MNMNVMNRIINKKLHFLHKFGISPMHYYAYLLNLSIFPLFNYSLSINHAGVSKHIRLAACPHAGKHNPRFTKKPTNSKSLYVSPFQPISAGGAFLYQISRNIDPALLLWRLLVACQLITTILPHADSSLRTEMLKKTNNHKQNRYCQIKFATLDSVYHVTLPVYPVI